MNGSSFTDALVTLLIVALYVAVGLVLIWAYCKLRDRLDARRRARRRGPLPDETFARFREPMRASVEELERMYARAPVEPPVDREAGR